MLWKTSCELYSFAVLFLALTWMHNGLMVKIVFLCTVSFCVLGDIPIAHSNQEQVLFGTRQAEPLLYY